MTTREPDLLQNYYIFSFLPDKAMNPMKINKFFLFTVLFCLVYLSLFSQSSDLNNEDLIILNEQNEIKITDDRGEFMWFHFSKKIRFKIINEEGIEQASSFTLPETPDPTYISHFPKERNFDYLFSTMKVNSFKAQVVSGDGNSYDVELDEDTEIIRMLMMDLEYYGQFKKYKYHIPDLNVGDEITVEYNYMVPYNDNLTRLSSFRIFFHSDIYKEKYSLNIIHDKELMMDFDFLNNANPNSADTIGENVIYHWEKQNLAACINEPGSRPYLDLPHIIFSAKPYDLYYTVPKSFEERFTPFYTIYARLREERHPALTLSIVQGVNTPQYSQIRRFIKQQTSDMDDETTDYEKLKKIHQTIADEFTYKDDLDFFTRKDIRDPKIGDQIGNTTLKDLSRNDLYFTLLLSLNMNYFTTYLSDNRSGVMSESFFKPMYDNDFLYSFYVSDDNFSFLYPKRARYGYYMNEIPFYFENTRARLVHLSDYLKKEKKINESFRQFILPASERRDNIRNTKVAVNINLNDLSVTFNAQVYLSGQFSTMTRGLYLYDYQHEKINELYNKKIWELNDQVVLQTRDVDIKTKDYPFTTQVNARYKADNLISKEGIKYTLDLKNWFNHIIYKDFSVVNRQMDFYSDFSNRDSYLYYIQFDKNVKLQKAVESFEIDNGVVNMVIDVSQISPNSIKLQTYFAISGMVEIEKMNDLEEVYRRLQELNTSLLVFTEE